MGSAEFPEFKPSQFWKEQEFQSSARLHLQHWCWLYTLGYTIDPKIELPKDKPFRVADVACCNGAWMLDLHREYPNAIIDGFDLTDAHFPGAEWMPPGIKFHVWDALSDVPDEFIGVFDVVHIRALYSAILDNKVEPVLENLLKMLKPGGYIQWDEGDSSRMRADIPPGSDNTAAEASSMLVKFFHTSATATARLKSDWVYALPKTLESKGCKVLTEDWRPARKELQRAWCDNFLTVWRGVILSLPEEPFPIPETEGLPNKMSRASFYELLNQSAEECKNGVFLNMPFCTFACRKAA